MPTTPADLTIRRAVPGDAAAYSAFSARLAIATFAAQNDPVEFDAYMRSTFGEEIQRRELESAENTVLLGEISGKLAAFAYMRKREKPGMVDAPGAMEIARFYIDGAWHGRGISQAMMRAVAREAREQGADTVWLGVWEHNPRAIAFYVKCGFEKVGTHTFMVGNDAQTDHVMAARLADVEERLAAPG
ncbi:MAG TPA: GNAT family N-acetyltransferase [Gemmatimonadales bacterium]|nr:GNAT family N-acetyltransferase [Gemmatimonadales bacterium]